MIATYEKIYRACEQAIYELIVDGKSSASFNGRSYTANDIEKLQRIRNYYKRECENENTLTPKDTSLSYPHIRTNEGNDIC